MYLISSAAIEQMCACVNVCVCVYVCVHASVHAFDIDGRSKSARFTTHTHKLYTAQDINSIR